MTDLEEAWSAVHDATLAGWHVGRPAYYDERRQWDQYAFDPSERPVVGLRSREWTARAESEEAVVREMARCLRQIGAGRAPAVGWQIRI
ncbi:hypothetical protein BH24CHL5_BH24CHL5_12170 [soil metagenome]